MVSGWRLAQRGSGSSEHLGFLGPLAFQALWTLRQLYWAEKRRFPQQGYNKDESSYLASVVALTLDYIMQYSANILSNYKGCQPRFGRGESGAIGESTMATRSPKEDTVLLRLTQKTVRGTHGKSLVA